MTANDFFYQLGEPIERLLLVLEEEQKAKQEKREEKSGQQAKRELYCINSVDFQMHKILISAKLLEEERECIFGDLLLKKQEKIRKKAETGKGKDTKLAKIPVKDSELFKLVKQEAKQLDDPLMENAIFIERVEESKRNTFYFMNYISEQVQNPKFLPEFTKFCDEHGVLHERRKGRMAI